MAWDVTTRLQIRYRMGDDARKNLELIKSELECYEDCFTKKELETLQALMKLLKKVGQIE